MLVTVEVLSRQRQQLLACDEFLATLTQPAEHAPLDQQALAVVVYLNTACWQRVAQLVGALNTVQTVLQGRLAVTEEGEMVEKLVEARCGVQ